MWILKEARLFGMQIRYVKIQIKYLRKVLIKTDNDNGNTHTMKFKSIVLSF